MNLANRHATTQTVMCDKKTFHGWHVHWMKRRTLEFTRTTHPFFTMLWGTIDQVVLGWNGFPTRGKKVVWSNGPNKTKVRQTGGNRVGKQGWVFGFLIKIWGPTHPHLERVCCGHNIKWSGFSIIKIDRDTNFVQKHGTQFGVTTWNTSQHWKTFTAKVFS